MRIKWSILLMLTVWLVSCQAPTSSEDRAKDQAIEKAPLAIQPSFHTIENTVKMKNYFSFFDSLTAVLSDSLGYHLNDYHLAHENPWLLNRLFQTDYYLLKEKGIINKKQGELTLLRPSDRFRIPDSNRVAEIDLALANTVLDINLPEFKLRIIQYDSILYEMPVRIGQDREKYLAMAGRTVDLRTKIGLGKIIRVNKNPAFINPSNNRVYRSTGRDDGIRTDLPTIPWLEPSINGIRVGQLIHPTTNPRTLGRKSSNGCIGTRECDAWLIYYYAPIGTEVIIRNDRHIIDSTGDTIFLPEVYKDQPAIENTPALPSDLCAEYLGNE